MTVAEVVFSILVLILINYLRSTIVKYYVFVSKINAIPGPKGYPIIGSVMEVINTPEVIYKNMNHLIAPYLNNGLLKFWLTFVPFVGVCNPEDIEIIFNDSKNNSKGGAYNFLHDFIGTGLLTSTGKKWQQRRKLLTPTLHFSILQNFLPIFVAESNKIVNYLLENESPIVTVNEYIGAYSLNTVCETAMGTPLNDLKDNEKYREAVKEFTDSMLFRTCRPWFMSKTLFSFSGKYKSYCESLKVFHEFSDNVINNRRNVNHINESNRMAMLDLLLKEEKMGCIDHDGLKEEVNTFIFEGHDTITSALSFTMMLIACNPGCQEKIYKELTDVLKENRDPTFQDLGELRYLQMCIKESLRLYPSAPIVVRKTAVNVVTSSGKIIPEGSDVLILIEKMHRLEKYFPNPNAFDPERFSPDNETKRHPFSYIPFSAGQRNCIGQRYAMISMKCFLAIVLKRFSLEPVDTPDTVVLFNDLILRARDGIKVKLVQRRA